MIGQLLLQNNLNVAQQQDDFEWDDDPDLYVGPWSAFSPSQVRFIHQDKYKTQN